MSGKCYSPDLVSKLCMKTVPVTLGKLSDLVITVGLVRSCRRYESSLTKNTPPGLCLIMCAIWSVTLLLLVPTVKSHSCVLKFTVSLVFREVEFQSFREKVFGVTLFLPASCFGAHAILLYTRQHFPS